VTALAGQDRDGSLAGHLESWLAFLHNIRGYSPHTISAYRSDCGTFLRWCAGNGLQPEPADITPSLLLQFIAAQEGLAPNTLRRRVHALGSWLKFMLRQGLLTTSPAEGLPLPRRSRAAPRYPDHDQLQRLLAAARTPLEKATAWLLAGTGVRRGELLSLDLADVAQDLSQLRVLGKGNRERLVPVPVAARSVLQAYLAERGPEAGALLLNRAGHRLGVTSLRRLFGRLVRRAGLQDVGFTLHSMRHAYATTLVKAGVDLGTIRDLLGHSDISVTSVYLHSDLRSRRAAVELLPLGPAGGDGHGQAA